MREKRQLLNKIIYQVFVRDYPPSGTLVDVRKDLGRIRDLGADLLYLMPIQPIGKVGRKGMLGSPYAIADYSQVDPALGTKEDLSDLIKEAHALGIQVLLDVVYNHTARESRLLREHPEYFYRDERGNFGNKAGCWSDVFDLDHSKEGLDELLVSYLVEYKALGIDGFRFDVASLLPTSFYKRARKQLGEEMVFLAECIDTNFLNDLRAKNVDAWTNSQLFDSGIDLFYPYASHQWLEEYLNSLESVDLQRYLVALQLEQASLPKGAYVTRCVENHDRRRINGYSDSALLSRNLLAFSFFPMGPAFVYFGEEFQARHQPSLFEKETVDFTPAGKEYETLFSRLVRFKKDLLQQSLLTTLYMEVQGHVLLAKNVYPDRDVYGIFNLSPHREEVDFRQLPKGMYRDFLTGRKVLVNQDRLVVDEPLLLTSLAKESLS